MNLHEWQESFSTRSKNRLFSIQKNQRQHYGNLCRRSDGQESGCRKRDERSVWQRASSGKSKSKVNTKNGRIQISPTDLFEHKHYLNTLANESRAKLV